MPIVYLSDTGTTFHDREDCFHLGKAERIESKRVAMDEYMDAIDGNSGIHFGDRYGGGRQNYERVPCSTCVLVYQD